MKALFYSASSLLLTIVLAAAADPANLALVATPSTSFVSGHETITALNDGFTPANSNDKTRGAYGNWPQTGTQWVQYDWPQAISTAKMSIYWFDDQNGVRLPKACRVLYWDGQALVPIPGATGPGLAEHRFNNTEFPEITTTRIRVEFDGDGRMSTGLLEWRVYDSGKSPNFAPVVHADVDRVVILGARTYLQGHVRDDHKNGAPTLRWTKASGPGRVRFSDAAAAATDASFTATGQYRLNLIADDGEFSGTSAVHVTVSPKPPRDHLTWVWPGAYQVSSTFWSPRLKNLSVNWIPHCIAMIEDPATKEGGIQNFAQAARKLAGEKDATHVGAVFANTWVYNTLESICAALMLDPAGDPELTAAHVQLRKTLENWIPVILSAQEKDGYLHTHHTIRGTKRWSNKHDHEDYQAGYFIEAAMAHYLMSGRQDTRLLDAARRLADCWVTNIGPAPKREWYPGHQAMELALVRFAQLVDEVDAPGKGRPYLELARYLLDARRGGDEYDQSHTPVTRQYEAVGHAVRAVYSYAGMAAVAMETGDLDYHSAVGSLWNSIVNRKYYVTGGLGSGETSEGFGKDYSLRNNAYSESCANCGELFFQHKLQLTWKDSRYADLYEETLYNAILGDVDLEGQNYTYTNPLDSSSARYKWHVCPCCVGNIPRTLLYLPSWMYATGPDELYVNLYAGSTFNVGQVAGTPVQVNQQTDYPWKGDVRITVNPAKPSQFALKARIPGRQTSELYSTTPIVEGVFSVSLNGKRVKPAIQNGYLVLDRKWKYGDTLALQFPLQPQRVKADPRIAANAGRVALRYGPLIYNFESVDQKIDVVLPASAAITPVWRPDLLGGVVVLQTTVADGSPLIAVPNYARLNRGGRSIVWIKDDAEPAHK